MHKFIQRFILLMVPLTLGAFGLRRWIAHTRERLEAKAMAEFTQERQRFFRRLDHELKNPLTAIRVELANLEMIEDADRRRDIRANIREQVIRLSNLVSGLRKLAQLETGQFEQLPVNTDKLLVELSESLRDHPDALNRRLILPDFSQSLPPVLGDEDLLNLAIYNLIENAMKFTQDGDLVALRVYTEDDELVIEVEDSGQGIPAQDLPYVWEELYRSKEAHGIPGSGLGLAIVWTVIDRHGGETDIRSQHGHSTTVTARLPVYHAEND